MLARLQRNERVIFGICLAFSFLLLAIFGFLSYTSIVLRQYLAVLGLATITYIAYKQLGLRKDRNYLNRSITFCVVSLLALYAIICFTAGIVLGFKRGYFSTDLLQIFSAFIPTLLLALVVEALRYLIAEQYLYSKRTLVLFTALTSILYILVEAVGSSFANAEMTFIFICTTFLPIIARETLCSFLSYRGGFRPALIYKLVMVLFPFVLPIVPALGDYLHSVANVVLPFVIYLVCLRSIRFFHLSKQRLRKLNYQLVATPVLALVLILTALVSGIFPFQLIAVGSDSMRPVYGRGDAVIFQKVSATDIQKNDILVFSKDKVIVTHRVVRIEERDGTKYFITRGDNNDREDGFETSSEQVLGRVISVSKYIGFPTVWLNEVFQNG